MNLNVNLCFSLENGFSINKLSTERLDEHLMHSLQTHVQSIRMPLQSNMLQVGWNNVAKINRQWAEMYFHPGNIQIGKYSIVMPTQLISSTFIANIFAAFLLYRRSFSSDLFIH